MDILKKYTTIAIMSLLTLALPGCGDDPVLPEPEPEPQLPATVERTVLVYMVANNNLHTGGGYDSEDLAEMRLGAVAGDIKDGRLIAYHSSPDLNALVEIKAEGYDTLKIYDNSELSVSASRMQSVIADTKELAPSKSLGMIFWSHASGWLQDGIADDMTPMLRSFGSDGLSQGKKMNITVLAKVLEEAKPDFIYFDCCYMGNVESLYELRNASPYIVASAAEVPACGMPYHLNLKHFFNTGISVKDAMIEAASTTFADYNEIYVRGDCPCTLSVIDTGKLETLAKATADIYSRSDKFYQNGYEYQKYTVSSQCYYYDLADYVSSLTANDAEYAAWKAALDAAVIYRQATPYIWSSVPINTHSGLSTYIMTSKTSASTKGYNTLSWYTDVASKLIK